MTRLHLPRDDYDFVVVGAFGYPARDASANRMLSLAQLAKASGRRPLVVNDRAPLEGEARTGTYAGIDYAMIGVDEGGRLLRLFRRINRAARLRQIIRHATAGCSRRVVVTMPSGLFNTSTHLLLQHGAGLTIVADVVERHDPSQFARGRFDPAFLRHRATSWLALHLSDGCIVISTELRRRFAAHRRTLLLPALADTSEFDDPAPPTTDGPLTLLYVGNPINKDELGAVIDTVLDQPVTPDVRPAVLRLAGPDRDSLCVNPDVGPDRVARFGTTVLPLGRLDRSQLKAELQAADFTVLFRRDRGYAKAGFPSKVPESLAAGCPVFGNSSSDLDHYLTDGENALLCRSDPRTGEVVHDDIRNKLAVARASDAERLFAMRRAARASAGLLSVDAWSTDFRDWLESL